MKKFTLFLAAVSITMVSFAQGTEHHGLTESGGSGTHGRLLAQGSGTHGRAITQCHGGNGKQATKKANRAGARATKATEHDGNTGARGGFAAYFHEGGAHSGGLTLAAV